MYELRFDGKTALVTGGGGGCGGAIARALAELGAYVIVADIDAAAAAATADQVREAGGSGHPVQLDVADPAMVRQVIGQAGQERGLDVLISTAGVIRYSPLLDQPESDLDQIIAVNIKGTYNCLQAAAAVMAPRRTGSIVNFASTAAFAAPRMPAAAYSMSKGGIRQLTVAAAVELAPHGVRVNALAPGSIPTKFTQDTLKTQEQLDRAAQAVPMGRLGTVDDVVGPALFLSSPLAGYVTGQVLVIDGGRLGRS